MGMQGIYLGGYPWKKWGQLTADDLNGAIQLALQEPHELPPLTTIPDGSIPVSKLQYPYIVIGGTPITLGQGVPTLSGLANPVNPQDVATKSYVDAAFGGSPGGGLAHFPNGVESPGGFWITDQTYPLQQYRWYANGGYAWIDHANNGDWMEAFEYATGKVYFQHGVEMRDNVQINGSLTVNGGIVGGSGAGGWIYDTNNSGLGWRFLAQNGLLYLNTNQGRNWWTVDNSSGEFHSMGYINTDIGYKWIDSANGPGQQWALYSNFGVMSLWNNGSGVAMSINYGSGIVSFPHGLQSNAWVWYDTTFTNEQWTLSAHDGVTYLVSNQPDVPNGRPNHPVWGGEWNSGRFFVFYDLIVYGGFAIYGAFTTTQGIIWNDRVNNGPQWQAYANNGIFSIWSSNVGDIMTFNTNPIEIRTVAAFMSNVALRFADPYYGNYSHQWSWYASVGTAHLWHNIIGDVIQISESDGLVRFPYGLLVTSYNFNDDTFAGQQWNWHAHGGMAYLGVNNGDGWNIGAQFDNGNVFIRYNFFCQQALTVQWDATANSWTFRNQNAPQYSWLWWSYDNIARLRTEDAIDQLTIDRAGNLNARGTIFSPVAYKWQDSANGPSQQWYIQSYYGAMHFANNAAGDCFIIDYASGTVSFPHALQLTNLAWSDDQLGGQNWRMYAHGGATYLESNNPDIPNGRGAHPIFAANWTTGSCQFLYDVIVNGALNVYGAGITTNYAFFMTDRSNANTQWAWYADGGLLRLWANNGGDRVTFDYNTIEMRSSGAIMSNTAIKFADPWFPAYSHQWYWYSFQGQAQLFSNVLGASVITVNETTGVVNFPFGANVGSSTPPTPTKLEYADQSNINQHWMWYSNGLVSRHWETSVGDIFGYSTAGVAAKPGGGEWAAVATGFERVEDYTTGLDAVLKLRPVSYQYEAAFGFGGARRHIGLVPDEVKGIMPEMLGGSMPYRRNEDDDDRELPTLDASALRYALVNAVKELSGQVQALTARLAALEAR